MDRIHIPVAHADADFVNGVNTINSSGTRTDGDQGIHIWCTLKQGAETYLKVFAVDSKHRKQQEKLGKGKNKGIFHSQQEARKRPVHHVPHRDIKQRKGMKKLVKSEIPKEQWDKTVDRYSDCEIYKVITENIDGELHSWVYFREGE